MIKENESYFVRDKRLAKEPSIMTGEEIIEKFISLGFDEEVHLIDDKEFGPYYIPTKMTIEQIKEDLKTWDIELDY